MSGPDMAGRQATIYQMTEKRCATCLIAKSVTAFARCSRRKDGLQRRCRQCHSAYIRARVALLAPSRQRIDSKRCNQCGATKAAKEFHKSNQSKDGLQGHCRQCGSSGHNARKPKKLALGERLRALGSLRPCVACHQTKPASEYWLDATTRDGLRKQCIACARPATAARQRLRRAANPEAARAALSRWREKNPDKRRAHSTRRSLYRYGLTPEDYAEMVATQREVCAICTKAQTSRSGTTRLSVDHCHSNGRVRGLLCGKCNSLLGYCGDSIDILEAAVRYLRKHAAKERDGAA